MGARKDIRFDNVFEALDAKRHNAIFTLSCRALAEPYNFYRIDGGLTPAMLKPLGTDAKILLECQKQFRQSGRYTPQTIGAALPGVYGVDGNWLHRTMQDAEMDLPLAFEHFLEIHGQWVEKEVSIRVLEFLHHNKTSEEIRVLTENYRRELGVVARQTGSDGKEEFEAELLAALENKSFEFPVRPHLSSLRKLIPFFEPGDYIVVAALTGVGKTYFGLNTVYENALNGVPCCIINLENTPKNIMKRLWQMHGQHYFRKDLRGSDDETRQHLSAWEAVKKMPVRSHNPGRSLPAILSTIRQEWNERGIQFALVDYAQLIGLPGWSGNRNYELGEISAEFRALALELQIPIMVLAQFKQEVIKYSDRRGGLYDIKDCANFSQDATFVISLCRPLEVGLDLDGDGMPYAENDADATIVKGRETGRAQAKCKFDPIRGFYEEKPDFTPRDFSEAQKPEWNPTSVAANRKNEEDIPF